MRVEPLNWDPKKVRRWAFKQPILNQYATKIEQHGVDGILLLHLDLGDVTTIGVRPYHRERVLQTIQTFGKESFPEDDLSRPDEAAEQKVNIITTNNAHTVEMWCDVIWMIVSLHSLHTSE